MLADENADLKAQRPKDCKLRSNARLCRLVAKKLQLRWSPEQISGWLRDAFPTDSSMRISHETIYRSLFVQTRAVLNKELRDELRTARRMRRPRRTVPKRKHEGIPNLVPISQRPASAEDRAVPGHWEGDLLVGSNNSYILTLVERASRFTMLIKVPGKDTASVIAALTKHVQQLPKELRKSITWDRGTEMAHHAEFTIATDVKVFFCDPQAPWQRGTNENTNGLLRQYFPKGTDVSQYTQSQLNKVARELNGRPRKTLGFKAPAAFLNHVLQ